MSKPQFCYWSVADGPYGEMMRTAVASARQVGVREDFHIWTDIPIPEATTHECGVFDKSHYLFKLRFLKDQVSRLPYDYFVFLDADTFFVRHPGDILTCLQGAPVHICLESDCTRADNRRPDWWGCLLPRYVELMRTRGVRSRRIFNTNAGFWIVHREVIDTVYQLALDFWHYAADKGYRFTEEAPLAYVGHMLCGDPYRHTLTATSDLWASDWTGAYRDRLPDGQPWFFIDYMNEQPIEVNPAIVHCMRSKEALRQAVPPPPARVATVNPSSQAPSALENIRNTKVLFVIVSDRYFFPGTLATVNSIRHFYPDAEIATVSSVAYNSGLSEEQIKILTQSGIRVYPHTAFEKPRRVLEAMQLKAYAVCDLFHNYDLIIGIDSDAILCQPVDDMIAKCLKDGIMRGGADAWPPGRPDWDGIFYNHEFSVYGFTTPVQSTKYMSAACYFLPINESNQKIIERWAFCCDQAHFGPQAKKVYPGHGDQGVLNAVRFAELGDDGCQLLPNELWSQHWIYDTGKLMIKQGSLYNVRAKDYQRVLHAWGHRKFWVPEHSQWVRTPAGANMLLGYGWWLAMFWFGPVSPQNPQAWQWIEATDWKHLREDVAEFYHHICSLYPQATKKWDSLFPALCPAKE